MALDLPSPQVRNFLDALEGFMENPPRDLPDGTLDAVKQLGDNLKGYAGGDSEKPSPGEREMVTAQGGPEPGAVPYKYAATGPDKPSPGQVEYAKVMEAVQGLDPSPSD